MPGVIPIPEMNVSIGHYTTEWHRYGEKIPAYINAGICNVVYRYLFIPDSMIFFSNVHSGPDEAEHAYGAFVVELFGACDRFGNVHRSVYRCHQG